MLQPLETRTLLAVTPVNDDAAPQNLFVAGSAIYFAADDGTHGSELWRSDGTPGGTTLVKDLLPGAVGAEPNTFVAFKGTTYFLAQNSNLDQQLWRTDGTAAGTQIVADIRTVAGRRAGVVQTVVAHGKMFMALNGRDDYYGLLVSDGTTTGTVKVRDFAPFHLVILGAMNGTLLINANGGDGKNNELWKTDGTAAGTVLVKDIFPGPDRSEPGGLYESDSAVLGNALYFGATVSDGVRQLWKSDGTTAGTSLVNDVAPSGGIVAFNGALYFSVGEFGVQKLWKSDGTTGGTTIFHDQGMNGPAVVLGDKLYYRGANDNRIWRTDGTAAGTEPIVGGAGPHALTVVNDVLYFTANDLEHGWELWKTDGATTTATLVKDIAPGQDDSVVFFFHEDMAGFNGSLYFPARLTEGLELWKSDGSAAGTNLFKDINTTPPDFVDKLYGPLSIDPWHVNGTAGDDTVTLTRDGEFLVVSRNGKNETERLQPGETIQIDGFDGNDTIDGSAMDVTLEIQAGNGDDSVTGGSARDTIAGVAGSDSIFGGDGSDRVDGGVGNDSVWGNNGADTVLGGDGVDSLYGNGGNDRLEGGANSDHMRGNGGRDTMYGNGGNDRLYGGASGDRIYGQAGNDQILGEGGNDRLYGDDGYADTLTGGAGDDFFVTLDSVADQLFGDGGRDSLTGDDADVRNSVEVRV
jgi:ELWxxDGT repeat protein